MKFAQSDIAVAGAKTPIPIVTDVTRHSAQACRDLLVFQNAAIALRLRALVDKAEQAAFRGFDFADEFRKLEGAVSYVCQLRRAHKESRSLARAVSRWRWSELGTNAKAAARLH